MLRRKPVDVGTSADTDQFVQAAHPQQGVVHNIPRPLDATAASNGPSAENDDEPKQKIGDRVRGIFGSMFD
ncbi:cell division protein FtsA C-terminal domain-containing protein [Streptococcus dentiloxodontae]